VQSLTTVILTSQSLGSEARPHLYYNPCDGLLVQLGVNNSKVVV